MSSETLFQETETVELDGLTIEAIRRGNVSLRRNPLIADLLRRIQMIEAWGRGMLLMLDNAPTAQFRQLGLLFIASFERPSGGVGEAAEGAENPEETPNKPRINPEEAAEKPQRNHRQMLLDLITAQPDLSVAAIAGVTGLSVHSVRHHLTVMKTTGRIRHVGSKKTGRWEIVDVADDGGAKE